MPIEKTAEIETKSGKKLQVKLEINKRISKVTFSGIKINKKEDFEKIFERLSFDEKKEKIALLANAYSKKYDIKIDGATSDEIAEVIVKALK